MLKSLQIVKIQLVVEQWVVKFMQNRVPEGNRETFVDTSSGYFFNFYSVHSTFE